EARAVIEPSVRTDGGIERYQFERQGYFFRDPVDSSAETPVFNRIVSLKDSWAKLTEPKADPTSVTPTTPEPKTSAVPSEPQVNERDLARAANPQLAARFDAYRDMGLSEGDADVLFGDTLLVEFFDAAIAAYDDPGSVAR